MSGHLDRFRAVLGLGITQIRRSPSRTVLVVIGITLAVLATTLLASIGFGALDTGEQKFEASGRELWLTGGPIQLSPTGTTPIENTVLDAHRIARDIEARPDVGLATPIAFQGVYVGSSPSNLTLITGVGVPGAGGAVADRDAFGTKDLHYANGTYDGPMTREAVVDPRTASLLGVEVGDTVYVGGSKESARRNAFEVVAISGTFNQFLGSPTITLHLSELQEVVGTTGTDRATLISIQLQDDADPVAVAAALEEQYPEYEIRTNREQLEAVLEQNAIVLASAAALVVLAVLAGLALTVNLLALLVYQQREELAALRALGLPISFITDLVAMQGVLLGGFGGALGLALTPVGVRVLNAIAARLVGFDSLLQTPPLVYLLGAGVALLIGTVSAAVAGWQVARLPPLGQLEDF